MTRGVESACGVDSAAHVRSSIQVPARWFTKCVENGHFENGISIAMQLVEPEMKRTAMHKALEMAADGSTFSITFSCCK